MGNGALAQSPERWTEEKRHLGVVAERKLRTRGKRLRGRVRRDGEMVALGQKAERDVSRLRRIDLRLECRGEKIRGEQLGAVRHAVVAAEREPAPRIDSGLRVKAFLVQAERWAVDIGESGVHVVAADIRLLGVSGMRRQEERNQDCGEDREGDNSHWGPLVL